MIMQNPSDQVQKLEEERMKAEEEKNAAFSAL
jgi:hypothetical protein